jgi:hypothetical protein
VKGLLFIGLLVFLQPMPAAQAYEADIHFSTTYVLARAVGWPAADALTIASANQGVDENQDTVAALEVDTTPSQSLTGYVTSSLHQAEKNLRFHCFSTAREKTNRISADVLEVISGRLAQVPDRGEDPQRNTRTLIALGTALHCQQDAHAHVGFGGSCGNYSGSCYGHTHQNFFDEVAFALLNKHYFNPDHPGVSGEGLLEALRGTASELSAHRPRNLSRSVPADELAALATDLRASGLELPDDVRRECNRYIAGKWLFEHFDSGAEDLRDAVEMLPAEVAGTCRNASLGSATVVRIPDPRYPRLNADASAYLVEADGSYQLIRDGDSSVTVARFNSEVVADYRRTHRAHGVRVQLSHWTQVLALPVIGRIALSSADKAPPRPR